MKRSLVLLSGLLLVVPASALAGEKPVAKKAVPKVVFQTASASYPKATIIETVEESEDGKKVFEVRLQDGTSRVDLKIDAKGRLVAQEHLIDPKAAPAPVINGALAPPFQDWKVDRVEKIDNLETPALSGYEVLIEKDGSKREILVTATGALLKQEEPDDHK